MTRAAEGQRGRKRLTFLSLTRLALRHLLGLPPQGALGAGSRNLNKAIRSVCPRVAPEITIRFWQGFTPNVETRSLSVTP